MKRAQSICETLLSVYEVCSGQVINRGKSSIMFSKNSKAPHKARMMTVLDIKSEARNEKSHGLAIYMGRPKSKTFTYLKDRVWKRIQGWKEKLLSKSRKEVLIKAIAQAIPTYGMSCFDLTKSLCDH